MDTYVDGFVFPIDEKHLEEYKAIAQQVAQIWKEYGALSYHEFIGDDLVLEGTQSFGNAINVVENERVIFGWVVFPSKEVRDSANQKVPQDSRMISLVEPLVSPDSRIFDAERMMYGGFAAFNSVS